MRRPLLALLLVALSGCSPAVQAYQSISFALEKLNTIEEYRSKGKEYWEQARPIFDFIKEVKDQKLRIRYQQAQGLFDAKRYQEAIASYDGMLAEDENRHLARFFKGICLDELHRWDEAQTCYSECIRRDDGNKSTYLFYRGASHYKANRLDKAKSDMDVVIALVPDYGMAWDYRGSIAFSRKDYPAAAADFKRGWELLPDRRPLGMAYALASYRSGDLDATEKAYSQMLQKDDKDPQLWLYRGITRLIRGDLAKALDDFESTRQRRVNMAKIQPHYHRVVLEMAASLASDADIKAFRARLDKYAESYDYKNPTDFRGEILRMVRGDAAFDPARIVEMARDEARKAQVPEAGRVCHAHAYLGVALLLLGKKEEARKELEAAIATQAVEEIEFDLAKRLLK